MKKLLAVIITWTIFMAPAMAQELERIGEWGTPPYHHIEQTGTALYAVSENGWIDVFDVTEAASPVRGDRVRLAGKPYALLFHNERAYVSSGWAGIQMLDVSDPLHPVLTGQVDLDSDVRDLSAVGNTLFIASRDNGLGIADLSDPDHPSLIEYVSEFTIDDTVTELLTDTIVTLIDGTTLFVSDGTYGLVVLDITDPRAPTYVNYSTTGYIVLELLVEDDLLIAGLGIGGVYLFDITDLTNIVGLDNFVSESVDLDGDGSNDYTYQVNYTYGIQKHGDALYIADGVGFEVLDISDTTDIGILHEQLNEFPPRMP